MDGWVGEWMGGFERFLTLVNSNQPLSSFSNRQDYRQHLQTTHALALPKHPHHLPIQKKETEGPCIYNLTIIKIENNTWCAEI